LNGGEKLEKSNIIISIIIVLCIAAAVAAYGITSSDNPVFSNLSSMGSNNANHGPGNHTATTNGSHSATTGGSSNSGGSSDSGSGGSSNSGGSSDSGSGGGSDSGSPSNSGSGTDNNDGGGSDNTPTQSDVSGTTVQNDAWGYISQEGCYPGTPYQSGDYWIVPIYDESDNLVDSIGFTLSGEYMGRM
jgi:hypothetical protein